MGQNEVFIFLKQNPNQYFTARCVSDALGTNIQSIYSSLGKLERDIDIKLITKPGAPAMKLYGYFDVSENIRVLKQEAEKLGSTLGWNTGYTLDLMILHELKELTALLKSKK